MAWSRMPCSMQQCPHWADKDVTTTHQGLKSWHCWTVGTAVPLLSTAPDAFRQMVVPLSAKASTGTRNCRVKTRAGWTSAQHAPVVLLPAAGWHDASGSVAGISDGLRTRPGHRGATSMLLAQRDVRQDDNQQLHTCSCQEVAATVLRTQSAHCKRRLHGVLANPPRRCSLCSCQNLQPEWICC